MENTCSLQSLQHAESMYGTASEARNYILIEWYDKWESKALKASSLSNRVKAHLQHTAPDNTKTLLIKKDTKPSQGFHVYFFSQSDAQPYTTLGKMWVLNDYEAICDLHFAEWLATAEVWRQPTWLVCTNGKRDLCCARLGYPVYQALQQQATDVDVWQCTHMGGHRFAPNLLIFPGMYMLGRVAAEQAAQLLAQNGMAWANMRGHTFLSAAAQAAIQYFAESNYYIGPDLPQVVSQHRLSDALHRVELRYHQHTYVMQLSESKSNAHILKSCTDEVLSEFSVLEFVDLLQV